MNACSGDVLQTALILIRQKGVTFSMERIFTERVIFSRRHYDLMTNHISDKYLNKILQSLSLLKKVETLFHSVSVHLI